jgi:hypothetical protein
MMETGNDQLQAEGDGETEKKKKAIAELMDDDRQAMDKL